MPASRRLQGRPKVSTVVDGSLLEDNLERIDPAGRARQDTLAARRLTVLG
jgi:hypothetical protein